MSIVLSPIMMDNFDIDAELNPPEVLHQIDNYMSSDFSHQDWMRIQYFKAKALFVMHRLDSAQEITGECIREAILSNDILLLVKSYVLQALCYFWNDAEEGIWPLIELAMEHAEQSGNFELIIHVFSNRIFLLRTRSKFDIAHSETQRITDLINRVSPSYTTVCAYNSIAPLYSDMSKWDIAIKYYSKALEHAQILSLEGLQLSILNNLGASICRVNDFPKAESILQKGLSLSEKLGFRKQMFLFNSNLGYLKTLDSKYEEAIAYYDKCMSIIEDVPNKPYQLMIDIFNNYSMCYWKLNQREKSFEYIDKAISFAQEFGIDRDSVQLEINKTNLLIEIGAYDEALSIVKSGITFYKKAKDLHQLVWVYRSLARLYFLKKEYKKSYETNLKLNSITDEYIAEVQKKEANLDMTNIKIQDISPQDTYRKANSDRTHQSHGFIGCSKAYHSVLSSALLAAQHQNTSVLILGESGTGKEIIAHMIHKNSLRRNQPFVPVNVGALSPSLVESELFGHTKGAYTGADTPTKGFFLQADKGTLFLDEITDMPFTAQSKLLRALESRKVTAVGSSKETPFDSRVISATSQDIRGQLSINQFRLDLFHRLNTIEIIIPPLRERREDIEPIFRYYLALYSKELNKSIPSLDRSLINMLSEYSFPGNVRELKNIVERMYILSKNAQWDAQLLCDINPFSFATDNENRHCEEAEEDTIIKALIKAKGKQSEAAIILNMSEATLFRRIKKYNLHQYTRKQTHNSTSK